MGNTQGSRGFAFPRIIGEQARIPIRWRASMPRFAIDQKGKLRMIDDGSFFGHNGWFEAGESIHTTSSNAAMSLARTYRRLHGKPLTHRHAIVAGSMDMWKAYRQLPVCGEQAHVYTEPITPMSACQGTCACGMSECTDECLDVWKMHVCMYACMSTRSNCSCNERIFNENQM